MSERGSNFWVGQLPVAALFAVIGLAALAMFVLVAEPPERQPRPPAVTGYPTEPLEAVLQQNGFEQRVREILAAGQPRDGERAVGRYSGSPGGYRTEQLIRESFARAGLEVLTQELPVTVPVTEVCELLDADGQPLPEVQLYPFLPSGLTPLALPAEGVSGRLVAVEEATLQSLSGHDPADTIAVAWVDQAAGWSALANVGVRALLVREDEAARALRANRNQASDWHLLAPLDENNFPRLVVRGSLERYLGQRVTLRARVTWQTRYVRNLIGVLPGNGATREALVLTAHYDSTSLVPELAPGAEPAFSLAALLETAAALAPYRGQLSRDVIFVATAGHYQSLAGVTRLLEAIEPFSAQRPGGRSLTERLAEHRARLADAERALELLADDGWPGRLPAMGAEFRGWFRQALEQVAGEVNLAERERALQARLTYLRAGSPVFREGFDPAGATDEQRRDEVNQHPLLRAYLAAKKIENQAANLYSLPAAEWVRHARYAEWDLAGRLRRQFEARRDHHRQQVKELIETLAVRALWERYERTLTLVLELNSGGAQQRGELAVLVGIRDAGPVVEPQVTELANLLMRRAAPEKLSVVSWGSADAAGRRDRPNRHSPNEVELESEPWFLCGRLAFTVVNYDFQPPRLGTPEDVLPGLSFDVARGHVRALARAALAMGHGQVAFKTIRPDSDSRVFAIGGRVIGPASSGGLIATHPMATQTVVRLWGDGTKERPETQSRGIRLAPVVRPDPYGRYELPLTFFFSRWSSLTADAARFDADGRVMYFKDSAGAAQTIHKSDRFPARDVVANAARAVKPVNIPLFRASPVALYDRTNPQTLSVFKQVRYLNRAGLTTPPRMGGEGSHATVFLEPDFEFYVGLLDGASGNEQILEYRAFLLNADPQQPIGPEEPELFGRGYRVADAPVLTWPMLDATISMLRTAEKRLRLQRRYGMADSQMLAAHQRAHEWLAEAQQRRAEHDLNAAANAAGAALAYAINNQPVIRQRISHAVVGILWYLGLLVPFVFFLEKLLFGQPDIRKQLLTVGILFVLVFGLLRLLHPAFQMVRAPLVILLGFVILLLTLLVTLMVGGKFRQNLKELRRKEGQVEGADVSRGGVLGTAFLLGLNNMRRRKVRTGLTCVTLVLITFVMICFTSVSTDFVNEEQPLGRSVWNGLFVRRPHLLPLDRSAVATIQQTLGTRYPVTQHRWLVTALVGQVPQFQNAEVLVDREFTVAGLKAQKRARVSAVVELDWREPQFSGLNRLLVTGTNWFPRPPQTRAERLAARAAGFRNVRQVILPDAVARALDITPDDVRAGPVTVNIRGDDYEVLGILDSAALEKLTQPDGQPMLPYDLNAVAQFGRLRVQMDGRERERWIVPDNVKRLPASDVVFVNQMPATKPGEETFVAAVGVLFPREPYRLRPEGAEQPGLDYRAQRRAVLDYLERTGEPAYYAVDGTAYSGVRKRARTLGGLLELVVPILLASLTVFNTMRSSVYERKDEIYVYNAVGIAPNHVFFIFMAEALVYAVVGAMCGYLLSQASGRALTALGLTGGLNMDYSSIETIYASLAIVAAVLLSTILPARDAARLAAPAETRHWELPATETDTLEFSLPFTFTAHDRVAVISYFWRWLDAHGAGSSGAFYCAPPTVTVHRDGELVPAVASTVWLKPYDLGVSQRMEISLPTDPETGEYIARVKLVRLSGHVAAWQRTLKPFLATVRKQFLNWRVTTAADRQEMYAEAKQRLLAAAGADGASSSSSNSPLEPRS